MTDETNNERLNESSNHDIETSDQVAAMRHRAVPAEEENSSGLGGQIKEFFMVLLYALLIAFILKTFVLRGFYIPSGSMENTLQVNDRVFVNVAGSMFGEAERGDIIVFKDAHGWVDQSAPVATNPIRTALSFVGVLPDTSNNYLVKRVIGVGGDHVVCCSADGKITVNGEEITEPYLYPGANPSDIPFDVIVPENNYFVLGDHRNNSADSRYHIEDGTEFISDGDVEGEVFVVAWPLSHFTFIGGASDVFTNVPENTNE